MAEHGIAATAGLARDDLRPVSWVDRLTGAIDSLPVPAWAAYGIALAAWALFVNAVIWSIGVQPPTAFDPLQPEYLQELGFAVYAPSMLALIHYLNGVARSKLAAFRPALDLEPLEYDRLEHELTTLPARAGALAGLAGLGAVVLVFTTELLGESAGLPGPFVAGSFIVQGVTLALLGVLIYHTIHQLRTVSRIHGLASRIDLYEPAPLHAFSQLTARTGAGLVVLTAYSFLIDPVLDTFDVALVALVLVVAAAAFVLPLEGMHRRIVTEKERLQLEANRRLKAALALLHRSVDEGDLSVSDGLNKTLESLQLERDAIARMPAWPWEPGTFRAFASALLVPIVIWLIIRGLERLV